MTKTKELSHNEKLIRANSGLDFVRLQNYVPGDNPELSKILFQAEDELNRLLSESVKERAHWKNARAKKIFDLA